MASKRGTQRTRMAFGGAAMAHAFGPAPPVTRSASAAQSAGAAGTGAGASPTTTNSLSTTAAAAAAAGRKRTRSERDSPSALASKCPALEVVETFSDVSAAAYFVEGLVEAYLSKPDAAAGIAAKHAPGVSCTSTSCGRVADLVFDLDDTLLADIGTDDVAVPLGAMVALVSKWQHDRRIRLHFITARRHNRSAVQWTKEQLTLLGITKYATLSLAPEPDRKSRMLVSAWKHRERVRIARSRKAPIVLSVGDQLTDAIPVSSDEELDELNGLVTTKERPYAVLRPHDHVSLWALKLRAKY